MLERADDRHQPDAQHAGNARDYGPAYPVDAYSRLGWRMGFQVRKHILFPIGRTTLPADRCPVRPVGPELANPSARIALLWRLGFARYQTKPLVERHGLRRSNSPKDMQTSDMNSVETHRLRIAGTAASLGMDCDMALVAKKVGSQMTPANTRSRVTSMAKTMHQEHR